jgi:hypothetical protein
MWPTTVGGLDGVGAEVAPQHGADGGQGPSGSRRVGRRDLAGGCRGNRGAVHGTTGADGGGIRPALSCSVAGQRVKNGWGWEWRSGGKDWTWRVRRVGVLDRQPTKGSTRSR